MTEAYDDGGSLVRVRAQVMMHDEGMGGWVTMGGGGISNVSVCKRIIQSDRDTPKHEYFIYGKRLSDDAVVLSCTIKKDFEYNKVMPTFHHWRTGNNKFGLTFQTAADARAFDRGVKVAVNDLLDAIRDKFKYGKIEADDDVFMAVNLPVERDGSLSSSGSATTNSNSSRHAPTSIPLSCAEQHHAASTHALTTSDLHHHNGSGSTSLPAVTNTSPASTLSTPGTISSSHNQPLYTLQHNHLHYLPPRKPNGEKGKGEMPIDTHSYVQLMKTRRPMDQGEKVERRDSIASIKKQQQLELGNISATSQALGNRKKKKKRQKKYRCRHCSDTFSEDQNPRGSCEYSPDYVRSAIDKLTCLSCAQCMLYHCMSDAEGEFPHHPCQCGPLDESCSRRWFGLSILSIFVPCLWFYLPLRACHRFGVSCHVCGGRHEAS